MSSQRLDTPGRFRSRRRTYVTTVFMAAAVLALMSPLLAQDTADYPDLEAVPIENPGSAQRVFWRGDWLLLIRFDGAISNVGGGPLELRGNPQTNTLNQMVETGGTFYDIGVDYPVVYENTDGHNHWHADRVMAYELWSEDKTTKVHDGSKVGFCLVDSDQRAGWSTSWYYGLAAGQPEWQRPWEDPGGVPDWGIYYWCGNAQPDVTDLRMGVTEGWRDTYDDQTNLQWLDVSDVQPGRYYVATIADPLKLIAETDDTNNGYDEDGKVWSNQTVTVPGYVAEDITQDAFGATSVTMETTAYGAPGTVVFALESLPSNGVLEAAGSELGIGDTFTGPVTYTPDPGFSGMVSFDYTAADASSDYPWNPASATVTLDAEGGPDITQPADQTSTTGSPASLQIQATGSGLSYSADGLPAGLTIDPVTGLISGTPTTAGGETVTVDVSDANVTNSVSFGWTVNTATNNTPVVTNPGDQFSNRGANVSLAIVATDADDDVLSFSASDLPAGLSIDAASGVISGTPTTLQTRSVTVSVFDGTVGADATFTWTIVQAPNQEPTIVSPGFQVSAPGQVVDLTVSGSDPDADALTYVADNLPDGLTIDPATGRITGTVAESELEGKTLFTVTVTVTDGSASASAAFDWAIIEQFADVPTTHTFFEDIGWMVAAEVTFGCGGDSFCPEDPLTRGQAASFFARALKLLDGAGDDLFTDDDSSVHELNIDRIATAGITVGCDTNRFCPDDLVTRGQVASLIVRAFDLEAGAGANLFTDDDGSVHEDNIDRLATAGITLGCTTDHFCPADLITRGQFAALLHRAVEAAGGI